MRRGVREGVDLSVGALIWELLLGIIYEASYLWEGLCGFYLQGDYPRNFKIGVLNSPSENSANVQNNCSCLKTILKKLLHRGMDV